ncbi:MAG TPA: DUF4337 family protein [Gemmataceae bacterium]|jgi:hypothetical protein|nr:DUF4337 family protein [Gemmataceae bacterium]
MTLFSSSPEKSGGDPDKTPKSFWEPIFTITPVMLTILATLLAGLSSSEMSRAQYYRSLAAQYQSKAGDQWGFFQAKRIRSTTIEQELDLFSGKPVNINADKLSAGLQNLQKRLQESTNIADQLRLAAGKALAGTEPVFGVAWHQALKELEDLAKEKVARVNQEMTTILERLNQKESQQAFTYLETFRLPSDENRDDQPKFDAEITSAIQAIQERRPEKEIAALVLPISESKIAEAVDRAENQAKSADEANRWLDKYLRDFDPVIKKLVLTVHVLDQAVAMVEAAGSDLSPGESSEDLQKAVAGLTRWNRNLQIHLQIIKDFQAVRKDFAVRRGNREAQDNLKTAWVYELRVHLNSVISDRHRQRSQHFFFGMLAAQAGTAIASLALAARYKSSLWSLASLAGLSALGFSLYVYLFV